MKLKKYDDFNKINENEYDEFDGNNKLPQLVKDNIKKLLDDIKRDVINDSVNHLLYSEFNKETDNELSYTVNVILEPDFTKMIRQYIVDFVDYGIEIYKKNDSRTTLLIFKDGDDEFIIPMITTMSSDNMIYKEDNKLKYKIWINTYVARKK